MAYLALSRRAFLDIQGIESYSIEKWGAKVANDYIESIEAALNLLRENPQLLRTKQTIGDSLSFYRVKQHFLACALFDKEIYVLTVKHGAMDLPNRIREMEPQLLMEADMLHKAHNAKRS
jgi:plasmid stabilization system protein ParE|tara:strand:+ start:5219 stop:5578 length:360 start_codon:yes stop_codon:yes gene_type:complete